MICLAFASRALALVERLSMIGKLLRHNKIDTTSLYAHLAWHSTKPSSTRVAGTIAADIQDRKPRDGEVSVRRYRRRQVRSVSD